VAFPNVKSQFSQFQTISDVSYPIMGKWLVSHDGQVARGENEESVKSPNGS